MCEIYKNLSLENIDYEIWKEIKGYDGDYQVSNFGRVKSFKHNCGIDERILRQHNNGGGYLFVTLSKNGKVKSRQIHTLMFETHIEKIPKGYVIHHIDFTKNNILDNLQMMTNEGHSILHHTGLKHSEKTKKLMRENHADFKGENHPMFGKHQSEKTKKLMREKKIGKYLGENHSQSILTEQKVIQIRKLCDEGILTQAKIGEKFGVSRRTISNIKNRRTWKHI